jgi:hypothetical protein
LGEVRNTDLPELLPQLSVAIVPFRECDAVTFADPIKVYEYFWYGLPVVYKSLALEADMACLAYGARSADQFVENIAAALQEQCGERTQARKTLARLSTWNHRIKCLSLAADRVLIARQ